MTNLISPLLYLFTVGIALATLYLCFLLHRRFQLLFLLNYLYFISTFFVAGFIDLIGRYLAFRLLSGQPAETIMLLNHIFVFLVFPFIPLAIYFFCSFLAGFLQKKIPPYLTRGYVAFWALFFLILVLVTKNFLRSQDARISVILFSVLDKITFASYLLILAFALFLSRDLKDSNQRKAVRIYSLICFFGFTIILIFSQNSISSPFDPHLFPIFLHFSANLPPLLYLRYYLRKFQPAPDGLPLMLEANLEEFYSKYGLSKREQEIIELILKGKSNKDITGELFISLHTVKNHIYHIYQKLDVKSRLQLIRVVQSQIHNKSH
ncbi:MAG: hypothetical protein GTO29_08810 [Candidatus Latescibacteria bacterium]|nr:hypothetical protein [Candidatus Latescibacterota bacterium]NIO56263.1 hypothetical protein [Candidatus Latescibacterota bacterium]